MSFKQYITELKRRNVIKSALAYLVVSWVIIQITTTVLPTFGAPPYLSKTLIFILAIGFPLWLIFTWVYEITEEGIKKTKNIDPKYSITPQTSNRLNKIIIGALCIAIIFLLVNQFSSQDTNVIKDEISGSSDSEEQSIAVLAFADMSSEHDQEYLGDGIAEEILNILSRVEDLKVISRTSSFQFKGEKIDVREVGSKLGVKYVLEGSVRKFDNNIRITAQLINSLDGSHVWSKNFDRVFTDLFKIQDEIAKSISDQLQISMGIRGVNNERGTNSIEAYEYFLKGDFIHYSTIVGNDFESETIEDEFYSAEKMFLKAIELDSNFAEAHAELANLYDSGINIFPNDSLFRNKSLDEIDLAYKINPNSSIVNYVQAEIKNRTDEHDEEVFFLKKSIELDPYKAFRAYKGLASRLMFLGLYDEGRVLLDKIVELDPINLDYLQRRGYADQLFGRFDAAEKDYKEVLLIDNSRSVYVICKLYCIKREISLAEEYYNKYLISGLGSEKQENNLKAYLLAAKGDQKALEYLRSQEILLMLGNYDEWFDYMEALFEEKPYRCFYHALTVDPNKTEGIHQAYLDLFVPLRKHTKYPAMLKAQKKRYEDIVKRFSLKNSILSDM